MLKRLEVAGLAVALTACAALLVTVAKMHGAGSEAMAAWVQAIGTIAAILLVTFPVVVEHRMQRRRSRQLVLAAAEMAYGTMSSVAERNINPDYVGSEWWVPQWEILDRALADCPTMRLVAPKLWRPSSSSKSASPGQKVLMTLAQAQAGSSSRSQ